MVPGALIRWCVDGVEVLCLEDAGGALRVWGAGPGVTPGPSLDMLCLSTQSIEDFANLHGTRLAKGVWYLHSGPYETGMSRTRPHGCVYAVS